MIKVENACNNLRFLNETDDYQVFPHGSSRQILVINLYLFLHLSMYTILINSFD